MLVSFLTITTTWFSLQTTGYCFPEWRFLTETELVQAGIQEHRGSQELREVYGTVENFLKEKPDCCRLIRVIEGHPGLSVFSQFHNNFRGYIRVEYPPELPAPSPGRYDYYTAVSGCGRIINTSR